MSQQAKVPSSSGDRLFRADATIHIEAPSHDAAQDALADWVAEHMPQNFVIGWTLTAADDEASLPPDAEPPA